LHGSAADPDAIAIHAPRLMKSSLEKLQAKEARRCAMEAELRKDNAALNSRVAELEREVSELRVSGGPMPSPPRMRKHAGKGKGNGKGKGRK
jgi:hypothetical protein